MIDPRDPDQIAQVRAVRAGGLDAATADCLDDDTIAALADGGMEGRERDGALAHLARCARCRRVVASVARALVDSDVALEVRSVEQAGRRRTKRLLGRAAAGLAAAAALVLLVRIRYREAAPPHRAAPITAAPAPDAVAPVGPVADARMLRWTPVSGANRYRVTVFDADGGVRLAAELDSTTVGLPDSIRLVPGEQYWWKVDARLGFDRWVASELIEFSVRRVPR